MLLEELVVFPDEAEPTVFTTLTSAREEVSWQYYVVLYVDLLGQKEGLKKFPPSLPRSDDERHDFRAAAHRTYNVVRFLRGLFIKQFEESRGRAISDPRYALLTEEGRAVFDSIKGGAVAMQFFSDCDVLYAPLCDAHARESLGNVLSMLTATANAILGMLAIKRPFRGGVELGIAAPWPDGGIYGPVLAEVHRLETCDAKWPRVVIGDRLRDYAMKWSESLKGEGEAWAINRDCAKACLSHIRKDSDGCWMLDFLGEGVRAELQDTEAADYVERAYTFVCSEHEKHQRAEDAKLSERYLLLRQYFESHLGQWCPALRA